MLKMLSLLTATFAVLVSCSSQLEISQNLNAKSDFGIIGGEHTPPNHTIARSTVALITNFDDSPFTFCSGTLISKNLILTATHCIESLNKEEVFIHIGGKLPTTFDEKKLLKVVAWKTHPQYEIMYDSDGLPVTGLNDIALITIEGELPKSAKPALIGTNKSPLSPGQQLILAGYGILEELEGPIYATELNHVQVPIAKLINKLIITDQTSAKGACSGDSGGPAFVTVNKDLAVVGITRGPHDKASDCRHFGEYTSALEYQDFIIQSAQELKAEAPQFIDLR